MNPRRLTTPLHTRDKKWALTTCAALGVLMFLLSLAGGQAQDESQVREVPLVAYPEDPLDPYPSAIRELISARGMAFLYVHDGVVLIHMQPNGAVLPEGTVLEGWLVDMGKVGPWSADDSDASHRDQTHGPTFGDPAMDILISAAPYARSVGLLTKDETGNWSLEFHIPNSPYLTPYDLVWITAESDGNTGEWDPRPGTPIFYGVIDESPWGPAIERLGMVGPIEIPALREPIAVPLERTSYADSAWLWSISGQATLYATPRYGSDTRRVDFTVQFNDQPIPSWLPGVGDLPRVDCLVLEGWLVDAGLLGGEGVSHASDADEAWGVAFDRRDVRFAAAVEAAPYALSTGVAADNGDGTLSASIHFPGYNFDPFDTFMVTVEGDCNEYWFDPRPGTPVLIGRIGG